MRRADLHDSPDADAPVSKTRRKRAMHDLQALGETLVGLDRAKLESLALPERLFDAVVLARSITKHEARRRQLQFVGRLMRDVDPGPIADAIARWEQGPREEKARFAALERLRERLLADDAALDELLARHPDADRAHVATLVREARLERAGGHTPRRYRELFRALKALESDRGRIDRDDD